MTKAYVLYKLEKNTETLLAAAPNLRDVLAVGSHALNDALKKGCQKPEFKVVSCDISGVSANMPEVDWVVLPLDIQVGAKIVAKESAA